MRRLLSILMLALTIGVHAQTLNVKQGSVVYAIPASKAGEMTYSNGETLTIMGKEYALSDIEKMYVDKAEVVDNTVSVAYSGAEATVTIAANVAPYVKATVSGAHVKIEQTNTADVDGDEITYILSGSSADGEFYMTGSYKASVELNGLTLTNATPVYSGAALCIMDGKRIELSVKKDTENTVTDCATPTESLAQKAAIYCKGHLELKGQGTLNVYGKYAHAVKSAEYMQMRKCTVNILESAKDGISCDEYFLMESGTLTVKGTADDAIQCDIDGTVSTGTTTDHEGEDSGDIYIVGGTLNITATANGGKGLKAGGDVVISGGDLTVTQTGNIVVEGDDISYPTSVKSTGNITISGGSVTVKNTAQGGKGLSADGAVSISGDATTVVDITANGQGGTAETSGTSSDEPAASYKVYVSVPTQGGGGPGGGPGGWW